MLGRLATEACAHKAQQTALHKAHQHAGGDLCFHRRRGRAQCASRRAQALAQRRFDALKELVHAHLQALMLQQQSIAHQHTHHAGVALCELQHQGHDAHRTACAVFGREFQHLAISAHHLLHQREDRLLDEIDQAFKHLCLARKVAVQRSFTDRKICRQCSRGDAVTAGLFQHGRQRLKNLLTTLAGFGTLARTRNLFQRSSCNNSLGCFGQRVQNFRFGHKASKSTGKSTHSLTENPQGN